MSLRAPVVLGIETSCDDTACAIVDGRGRVLSSVVSSQLEPHRPYGGVVPEIASREHLRNWTTVSAEALERAGVTMGDVDAVAATRGPGLVGSLLVGLSIGKAMAFALDVPFCAVHHMEGHLFSPYLGDGVSSSAEVPANFVGLVVSGGHSLLLRVGDGGAEIETIAQTRDDAMGEVFDKIGKRVGLPFPGGALVDRLAEDGNAGRHPMGVGRCGESLDFSFSGLKSRALRDLETLERAGVETVIEAESLSVSTEGSPPVASELLDLLAGFRAAAVDQLLDRVTRLHRRDPIGVLAVSGGAAANRLLRRRLAEWAREETVDLDLVELRYSGDNAAMIAHTALLRHRRGLVDDPRTAEAQSRIPL